MRKNQFWSIVPMFVLALLFTGCANSFDDASCPSGRAVRIETGETVCVEGDPRPAGFISGGSVDDPAVTPAPQGEGETQPQPANVEILAIPFGGLSTQVRKPIVVRECDFRGSSPVCFYYPRWLESGQQLDFGQNIPTQGANRDGWMGFAGIAGAAHTAWELALADLNGNIPNVNAWLQIGHCPEFSAEAAKQAGLELNPNTGDQPFVRVTANLDPKWVRVCEEGQRSAGGDGQPEPTKVAAQPTAAPTVAPTPMPTPLPCPDAPGFVGPVPAGAVLPPNCLVVVRFVDHSAWTINVQVMVTNEAMAVGPAGMLSVDAWWGYQNPAKASSDACREAMARVRGSQTQGSWEHNYQVTFEGGPVPATCP